MAQILEASDLEADITNVPLDSSTEVGKKKASEMSNHGGFLFIEATGQRSKHDRQQIRALRGHVMHNYLQRKGAETQEAQLHRPKRNSILDSTIPMRDQSTHSSRGQIMRFRMRSGELEPRYPYRYRKRNTSTRRSKDDKDEHHRNARTNRPSIESRQEVASKSGFVPGVPVVLDRPQRVDVFGVLPVHLAEGDDASLQLFTQYERYPWCPINGQNSWSAFAISDQLVFHATMFSWGTHFRSRRPKPDPQEEMKTLQHKVAAIALVNDRLSDTDQALKVETLAAVAALTNIALVLDSYSEASKHMAGLAAIVQMRGGLSTLASDVQQHLQRLISWNDLIYSEVFDEKLRFPPIDIWEEAWATLEPRSSTVSSLPGLSRAEVRAAGVPRHAVVEILHDIRDLCNAEQHRPLAILDDQARMLRGDMFHRLERKLRVIVQGNPSQGNGRWNATVWTAVSLAALIFVHHHLRGNPLRYRHFKVISIQLWDTLLIMDEDLTELDFAPSLLIWMLCTGAVVTSSMEMVHTSFVFMLKKACIRHGLTEYEEFRGMLRRFLWTGDADEARYSKLWKELEKVVLSDQGMKM